MDRSLVGCSLWGRKELDTAQPLTHTHTRARARARASIESMMPCNNIIL